MSESETSPLLLTRTFWVSSGMPKTLISARSPLPILRRVAAIGGCWSCITGALAALVSAAGALGCSLAAEPGEVAGGDDWAKAREQLNSNNRTERMGNLPSDTIRTSNGK